ncbi:MAG TPA: AIPR family protein [Dehalococcoidia bacterium]|nr:AIPR family protein [Dehalococcoidia bacterium]
MLPFKLIAVESLDDDLVKNITRYSNKQNAVRGRDFLTLEDVFHQLREKLKERGYYLEVQTGEYGVLPKAEKERYPRDRLVNAFDALRFYGAGPLSRPHTAFGRSGDFTPGGREFDGIMDGLTEDDLLVPWLIARHAEEMGYSVGAKWHATGDDHRNQTRYFFLHCFFRAAAQTMRNTSQIDHAARQTLYADLLHLMQHAATTEGTTPFQTLLSTADAIVSTFMSLARLQNWYADRNAFLKREDILQEDRFLLASAPALLERDKIARDVRDVLGAS